MKEFMVLIREDLSRMESMTEADFQAEIEVYMAWVETMAEKGQYVAGDPLGETGRWVGKDSVLSSGPFIESHEAIGGYVIVKAADLDAAVELVKGCPVFETGGILEVRPIHKHE